MRIRCRFGKWCLRAIRTLLQAKVVTVTNSSMNWRRDTLMHNYKVITLPMAEDDIQDQTDYIAFDLKSPETAINMARGFRKTINNLSIFPQSHEFDEDEELEKLGIRKTYYKNYKIYFLIDEPEKTVYILRVFHMLVDSKAKILKFFKE